MATTPTTGRLHNLGTVIAFEVRRTLTRRTFWAMTLAVPALMLAVTALVMFSNRTTMSTVDAAQRQSVPFTYADASGLIDANVARTLGGSPASDPAAARADVVAGRAELFIAYPADPVKQPIEVAGRDKGITGVNSYSEIARTLLVDSAKVKVADAHVAAVLTGEPTVHQLTYVDGKVAPGWGSVVLPGLFIVVFYLAIVMLGNQMLNITVEEKENRVTEMILTTIHPTTLIVGKLLALVAVGIVQALVFMLPLSLAPALLASLLPTTPSTARDASASLPMPTAADIASVANGPAVALGAVMFLGSLLLFTGLLVSVGAIMPTAKDAGSAFGAIVLCLFLPFYAIGVLMSDPHGVASQVLTFFPLTAPVTAMARNATGTLLPWEAGLAVVIIYACAAGLLALGIRLFRTGSISYDARLDVRKVLGRRHQTA